MNHKHSPLSLEKIKDLHQPVRNINEEQHKRLSRLENLALVITQKVGTMGFFLVIFIWTLSWLAWNTLAPEEMRFDPFPAFVMWLFISNVIQLMLLPLLMVGQNLQGRHAQARAQADYEVNTRAELAIKTILQHLENQEETLEEIRTAFKKRSTTKKTA